MTTYTVTTNVDENDANATVQAPGGAGLSLREAIALANASAGADTIQFASSLNDATIKLSRGELTISSDLKIVGDIDSDGTPDITVDALGTSRVFQVLSAGIADMSGLIVTGGSATTNQGFGGGIRVEGGTLTFTDGVITGNKANGGGAGGGGLENSGGTVTLENVLFSGNTAAAGGAIANSGTLTAVNITVVGNTATSNSGGIININTMSLTNATVTGNFDTSSNPTTVGGVTLGSSGTITNSIVLGNSGNAEVSGGSVTNSIISGNANDVFAVTAVIGGGVLAGVLADNGGPFSTVALKTDVSNRAIDGSDNTAPATDARGLAAVDQVTVVNANGSARDLGSYEVVTQFEAPSLVVTTTVDVVDGFDGKTSLREAITYANAHAGTDIITFASSLNDATIKLSLGELAITSDLKIVGDIDSDGTPDVTVDAQNLSRVFHVMGTGVADMSGLIVTGGSATANLGYGGGIKVTGGTLTFTDGVITGNKANGGGAGGGGLENSGGTVTLESVLFSGNTAAAGGAMANSGTLTAVNITVVGNTATNNSGGIINIGRMSLTNATVTGNSDTGSNPTKIGGITLGSGTMTNSIVLGNSGDVEVSGGTVTHSITSGNANDVFAVTADIGGGVLAGVLADNGGPIRTVALNPVARNPAIDAGNDSLAPATDARGESRLDAPGVANNGANISDLGAFELTSGPHPLVVTTLDDVVDLFDGTTSLREAIAYANTHTGADTITFDTSLKGGLIRLGSAGTLQVTDTLTIDGDIDNDGRPDITISGDRNNNDIHSLGSLTITDVAATRTANLLGDNVQILNATAALTVDGLRLTGGSSDFGGSIGSNAAITISNSELVGNYASSFGGAVYSANSITVSRTLVSANATGSTVGGLYAVGDVTITDTTISGNTAGGVGGGAGSGLGTLTATNATVVSNSAMSLGGLLANGSVHLINSTVTGNSGGPGSGGGVAGGFFNGTSVTLTNSIVAGNEASSSADVYSANSIIYTGLNIVGIGNDTDATDGVINAPSLDAIFASVAAAPNTGIVTGVLADNGGLVPTVALKVSFSNPAIDASDSNAPATDARGFARGDNPNVVNTNGTAADLGAFEAPLPPTVTAGGAAAGFRFLNGIAFPPVKVDPAVTVTDTSSGTLQSATVAITAGFASGDVLAATTAGTAIAANFDPATGVLTLTGTDTLANYQAVLRSITFATTAPQTAPTTRTLSTTVDNGVGSSNVATDTLFVSPITTVDATGTHFIAANQLTITTASGITAAYANDFGDTLDASQDANTVLLVGGGGNDTLKLGAGGGTLIDTAGTNQMFGGATGSAANVFIGGGTASNTMHGGAGTNVYYITAANTILGAGVGNTAILLDDSVNLALGTSGVDTVILHGGANKLDMTGSTDFLTLYGAAGNDTLFGGSGGGYLIGAGGVNELHGGAAIGATDVFVGGSGGSNTMFGGHGANVFYTTAADTIHAAGTSNVDVLLVDNVSLQLGASGLDEVILHGGTNTLDMTGSAKSVLLYGATGNDTITTGTGGGYLIGGAGTNVLHGGGAAGAIDIFVGGSGGSNAMFGGGGANIFYTTTSDTIHAAGVSNTNVLLVDGVTLALGASGLDAVLLHGGDNLVDMAGATKTVSLFGAAGNDKLYGGTGDDYLVGAGGANTFGVHLHFGHDRILDWNAGTNNVIDLRDLAGSGVHSTADLGQAVLGGNLVITIGADTLTLDGVAAPLSDTHFQFA